MDPADQAPAPLPEPVTPHRRQPPRGRTGPTHHPGLPPPLNPRRTSHLRRPRLRPHSSLLRTDRPRQQARTEFQHPHPRQRRCEPDDRRGSRGGPGYQQGVRRHPHAHHRQHIHPNIIGALPRKDHPLNPTPEPYNHSPGWKMFFASDSPHYQRATQLATTTVPVGNGAIFTFGTPDTYPTILNQW